MIMTTQCFSLLLLLLMLSISSYNAAAATIQDEESCSATSDTDGSSSCQASLETNDDDDDENDSSIPGTLNKDCKDYNDQCETWASKYECSHNPKYMLKFCPLSCRVCKERIYSNEELRLGLDMGVAQVVDSQLISNCNDRVLEQMEMARSYIETSDILPNVKKMCVNDHELCSIWAAMGKCETSETYMKKHCTAACQACLYRTIEGRCPIDPNAPNAWGPGDLDAMFTRLTNEPYLSEYDVQILSSPTLNNGPWVITMENILSEEEATTLIHLGAVEGYERSSDVGKLNADGSHTRNVNSGRTSSNAWCQNACYNHETSQRIVHRLSNITGIPEENSEYLQLLRYEPGQHYQAHHDYIPHHVRRQQGVRILTLYLYLNDVEAGGATNFDKLNLTVTPKRGRALLWPSVLDDAPNDKDDRTSHQALPVEAGIKYGANAWFHMRDFKTALRNRCE